MQTAGQLARRITSATDLHDIVRTMKSMAAVSISHYEQAVESIDEYYRTVHLGLQAVLQRSQSGLSRRDHRSGTKRLAVVVFGSDQGMCGGFNDRIVDFTTETLRSLAETPENLRIICVGTRAAALLDAAGLKPELTFAVPGSLNDIVPQSQKILATINDWQKEKQVGTIKLLHNSKTGAVSYTQELVHLLPLADEWFSEIVSRQWPSRSLPVYTMERSRLFSALVHQYLFVSLYRAFAQSMATENASRLSSMQAAEKNIEEQLEDLNTRHRRQRQSSITSELLDIVSGFEALAE